MNKTIPLRLRTYEELQEIVIELNARVMLKDKQINNAIEFCENFKKKFRYDLLKHCHLDEIMDILRGIK